MDADQLFNKMMGAQDEGSMREFGAYLLSEFGGPKGLAREVFECFKNAPATAAAALLNNVIRFLDGVGLDEGTGEAGPDDIKAQALQLIMEIDGEEAQP